MSANPMTPTRLIVIGLVFAGSLWAALHWVWPILHPSVIARAPLDPQCRLRTGACVSPLPGGGQVRFRIEPDGIPVLKPLDLQVQLQGIEARGVEVDFAGTDMNMGYNRVRLQPQDSQHWRGDGMLPSCVRNRMEWEATVLIQTASGILAAPFRFTTERSENRP